MKTQTANTAQLGFGNWLEQADEDNEKHLFLKSVSHLPGSWDEAVPYYRNLLCLHDEAMRKANEEEVFRLKDEAHGLAIKLNGGTSFGICAPEGSGTRLQAETICATGNLPLWGQAGSFVIDHHGTPMRIEIGGLFSIGGMYDLWPGFAALVVDRRKLFISPTGFRSFTGGYFDLIPNLSPVQFVRDMLEDFVSNDLNGKLVKVQRAS